jgi:ubiquinone biosynthesis protein UbiJ
MQSKESKPMAIKATATARAPRGTKVLTQAFFSAADSIPEAQRAAVVKAALAAIRDELRNTRDKARIAKAKAKAKSAPKAPRKPAK